MDGTSYNSRMKTSPALTIRILLTASALTFGCPGGREGNDARQAGDTRAATPDLSSPDSPGPGDQAPQPGDGPRDQFVLLPDTVISCGSCSKDQICVHFINTKTCKVLKMQCRHRGAACYSTLVNPCGKCESEVCGLWYTSKSPKCSMPVDGGAFPAFYCYCFSK